MAKRVAGICYIKVDGEQLEVQGGVECPLMAYNRETVMALAGPAGYKETAVKPYTKVNTIFVEGFPLEKLRNATDMTVTTEFPNGKVYTLSGAFVEGDPAAKADDGTNELQFGGMKGIWQ